MKRLFGLLLYGCCLGRHHTIYAAGREEPRSGAQGSSSIICPGLQVFCFGPFLALVSVSFNTSSTGRFGRDDDFEWYTHYLRSRAVFLAPVHLQWAKLRRFERLPKHDMYNRCNKYNLYLLQWGHLSWTH